MPPYRLLLVLLLGVFSLPSFAATDTVPAAHFTITGTPGFDDVTISDGPGRMTIVSSPSFESVTFMNKTNVVFDGLGGGDTVRFSNPYPAVGIVSLIVKNVARIDQNARLRYPLLGLDASDSVELTDPSNDVDRIEITAGHLITFVDADDVVIGGVSDSLAGLRTIGGIVNLTTRTGDVTLSDTDAAEVIASGQVTLGAGRDLTIDVDRHAVVTSWGGVQLVASRDFVLGRNGHANDVRSGGPATLNAGRRLDIAGLTTVVGGVTNTSISAVHLSAYVITQSDSARFVTAGTAAELIVEAVGLYLTGDVPGLDSPLGSVLLVYPRELVIGAESGISAPLDKVRIWVYGIRLGTTIKVAGLPVELSDEELDRFETRDIVVTAHRDPLEVTGPITLGTRLHLESEQVMTSWGSAYVDAPELSVSALTTEPVRWTITPSSVQWGVGAPIPYSGIQVLSIIGGGIDTFEVTPSAATHIHVYGYGPIPPETPGDTVTFELDGVADPVLQATLRPSGYEGTLSSSNRLPVQFWDIESFEHAPVHLSVTNTDGVSRVAVGGRVTYTVTIHNHAPIPIAEAQIVDVVPPQLLDVRWTCVPSAGSGCTPLGSGDVRDAVTLAAGGSVTYSISGTAQEIGLLTNIVTVTLEDYVELDAADNTATDVTTVVAKLHGKTRAVRRR